MKKITLLPLVAVTALVLSTGNSQARSSNPIVSLAHQIERQGADLRNEFVTHYRYSGAYRHLMSDMNQFMAKAEHIDQLSHDPRTSYRHIKTDVAELDELAHHIHEVVDGIQRGRFSGRVNCSLAHVHQKLDALNNTIHQLQRSIEAYAAPARGGCSSSGHGYTAQPSYNRGSSYGRTTVSSRHDFVRAVSPWIRTFMSRR